MFAKRDKWDNPKSMIDRSSLTLPTELTFQLPADLSQINDTRFVWNGPDKQILSRIDLTSIFSASPGFTVKQQDEMLIVENIDNKGAAKRADLGDGDVITLMNGKKRTESEAKAFLESATFGDPIVLSILRNNKKKTIKFYAE
jgi:S1-C subfamily serine protease